MNIDAALKIATGYPQLEASAFGDGLIEVSSNELLAGVETEQFELAKLTEESLNEHLTRMTVSDKDRGRLIALRAEREAEVEQFVDVLLYGVKVSSEVRESVKANLANCAHLNAEEANIAAMDLRDLSAYIDRNMGGLDNIHLDELPRKDKPEVLSQLKCFNCKESPVYFMDDTMGVDCSDCKLQPGDNMCEGCEEDAMYPHVVVHTNSCCPFGAEVHHVSKKSAIEGWKNSQLQNQGKT